MNEKMKRIEHSDFPLFFQIADKGSINAQRTYLRLVKTEYLVLILAAIFINLRLSNLLIMTILFCSSGVLLLIAIIVRLLSLLGFEKKWFSSRVIAESVKSIAWKYMTRAEPYDGPEKFADIDKLFLKDLASIRNSKLEGAKSLGKQVTTGCDITQYMRNIRGLSLDERKVYYNECRVMDQQQWYSKKANSNTRSKGFWFLASVIAEVTAIIIAFLLAINPLFCINPIGVFTTIVAIFLAWTQIRKHGELSQSYSLAVQDLNQISSMFVHIDCEEKFSQYVENAEDAISREHKMWQAKRES